MKKITGKTRRQRRLMDVKVLYSLESSPHNVMVAYPDRPLGVDIEMESRVRSAFSATSPPASLPTFGHISLKACLGAIYRASPELGLDERKDFTLYAVDPLESARSASQRQHGLVDKHSTRQRLASSGGSATPGSSSSALQAAPISVGKGFWSWVLAEDGEGTSMVMGVVRGQYEEEEELEVTLKLKEAPRRSREQYDSMLKSFYPGSAKPTSRRRHDSGDEGDEEGAAPPPRRRRLEDLRTMSSPPPVTQRIDPRRPSLLGRGRSSPGSDVETPVSQFAIPAATSTENGTNSSSSDVPALQLQLLELLRALQTQSGQSGQDASATARQQSNVKGSSLETLPSTEATTVKTADASQQLAQLLGSAVSSFVPRHHGPSQVTAAPSPVPPRPGPIDGPSPMGELTPGYSGEDVLRGKSPRATSQTPATSKDPDSESSNTANDSAKVRQSKRCYNCGIRGLRSWRFVQLSEEDRADIDSVEGSQVEEDEQARKRTPAGYELRRACNACGKAFLKTGQHREPKGADVPRLPRGRAFEEALANAIALNEISDSEMDELAANHPGLGKRARSGGLGPRTLSGVCERASKRTGLGPCLAPDLASARFKDFVKDSQGRWRTKRSILENPELIATGRPPGRKNGEAQGRSAQRMAAAKAVKQREENAAKMSANSQKPPTVKEADAADQRNAATTSSGPQAAARSHTDTAATSSFRVPRPAGASGPQTSPILPSISARLNTPRGSAKLGGKSGPPSTSQSTYGASHFLLESSPGTALETLLSEGDFDWHEMTNNGPAMPVRRSPRKHPLGTRAAHNPFATEHSESVTDASQANHVEPSAAHENAETPRSARTSGSSLPQSFTEAELFNLITTSPLTRGRLRSGNYELISEMTNDDTIDPTTSSDPLTRSIDRTSRMPSSSTHTTPASHHSSSPSRASDRLTKGRVVMTDKERVGSATRNRSPSQARKAARQARAAHAGATLGPFMGVGPDELGSSDQEDGLPGIGSPTLRPAKRRRRTTPLTTSGGDNEQPDRTSRQSGGQSEQQHLGTPQADAGDQTGVESSRTQVTSRAIPWISGTPFAPFNGPSPASSVAPDVGSSTNFPGTANVSAGSSPADAGMRNDCSTHLQVPTTSASASLKIARRPLPATVEDCPSSSASSSPPDAVSPDWEEMDSASLLELFDDPYGLLARSGIGITPKRDLSPRQKQQLAASLSATPDAINAFFASFASGSPSKIGSQASNAAPISVQQGSSIPAPTFDLSNLASLHHGMAGIPAAPPIDLQDPAIKALLASFATTSDSSLLATPSQTSPSKALPAPSSIHESGSPVASTSSAALHTDHHAP
ncbi:hypothetical protein CBOM_01278 [Ceraceosorus bombacis]|uniref:Ams2/SPT21 N-terminal domain-containing protein n=1 Tax=Ceraceosorus bombacis TaxID=401625 RepID=A0A0P1BD82_9BASI|nr:hypothetical protein CBOM_01278 [Ceraceosorus bombacis]